MTTNEDAPTLGQKLRALREGLGLSLRGAAERAGGVISYNTIQALETRVDSWDRVELGSLRAMARAYEMPLWDLLRAVDQDDDLDPNDVMRHLAKRVDLERSVVAGVAAVRDDLRLAEEHLAALEAEVARLRLR
jgi:transcriptional regulator with XRE-family HTH domain